MKKLLLSLSLVATLSAVADLKVGTIDLMLLIRNHPNYESNRTLLSETDKDYQKKLEVVKGEGESLQAEGRKLAERMHDPLLNDKAKADIEKQLMELQQKLIGIEQRYRSEAMRCRQDLQDLEARLLKTTTEDLRRRIADYAKANDYDLVIDVNAAAFTRPEYEITDTVLKAMGVDPAKARAKAGHEGK